MRARSCHQAAGTLRARSLRELKGDLRRLNDDFVAGRVPLVEYEYRRAELTALVRLRIEVER